MNAVSKKYQPIADPPEPGKKPRRAVLLFFLMLTILGFYAYWKGVDFLELDADGNVQLSPQRQKELDKRLQRLDQARQYVLRAANDGYYPCYNCGQDSTIFLFRGEIWKYGITYSGSRYSNAWLEKMKLIYIDEYRGTVEECLKQEAQKIYNYATLQENLKRKQPLIRPPGNKVDL
jgi:hypothetical protein